MEIQRSQFSMAHDSSLGSKPQRGAFSVIYSRNDFTSTVIELLAQIGDCGSWISTGQTDHAQCLQVPHPLSVSSSSLAVTVPSK